MAPPMYNKKKKNLENRLPEIQENQGPFQHISHHQKRAFLIGFAECGTIRGAERAAGCGRGVFYSKQWKDDTTFQFAFQEAERMFAKTLEAEAIRRGKEGRKVFKFGKGGEPLPDPTTCLCGHSFEEHLEWREDVDGGMGRWEGGACRGQGGRGAEEGEPCPCDNFQPAPYAEVKYSDVLLIFLMKGQLPEKYGERKELKKALDGLDMSRLPAVALERIAAGEHPLQVLAVLAEGGKKPPATYLLPPGVGGGGDEG